MEIGKIEMHEETGWDIREPGSSSKAFILALIITLTTNLYVFTGTTLNHLKSNRKTTTNMWLQQRKFS